MLKKILLLLPEKERRTWYWVGVAFFVQALLDFASIAALIPVLVILLGDNPNKGKALLLCVAVLVFIIAKNLMAYGLTRFQSTFLLRLFRYFSHGLFHNYYHRGLLFFKGKSVAKLSSEVTFICYAFSLNVLQPIMTLLGSGLLILLMVSALLFWEPLAGFLLCLGFVPLVAFYLMFIKKRAEAYGKEEIEARREQSRTVIEAFRGYNELEINNAYPMLEEAFLKGLDTINNCRLRMQMVYAVPPMLSEAAVVVGIALLLLLGDGDLRIMSGVFALAAFRLIPCVRSVMGSWTTIRSYTHCVDIIADGMKESTEPEPLVSKEPITFEKEIRAEHLTFAYPDGEGEEVIDRLSFTIQKGDCIGIRGASGSGKSTLFNLLLGFFPLNDGSIWVDDCKLTPDKLRSWHQLIGYVPQEIFIAKGDLAHNVALGQGQIDEIRLMEALEQARLKDWVETLPQGIHTDLGEYGNRLSGGQKQRIGIARALYKRAEILFFDEATSSLDNKTEHEVNDAIQELSNQDGNLTIIIIAHRDSSLTCCNRFLDL